MHLYRIYNIIHIIKVPSCDLALASAHKSQTNRSRIKIGILALISTSNNDLED